MAEENNKLQIILKEQGVSQNQAKDLLDAFGAPFEEAGKILKDYRTIEVTDEKQTDLMAQARSKRLALKETRVAVEHKRKELKSDIVKTGRAIDAVATFVKEIIQPAEAYLEQQEKFAEIKQAERAAALKAKRIEQLMQYTNDISVYNLDTMTTDQFETLLGSLKSAHEAKLAEEKRLADEAAAKKKADEEEAERVRQENARLKAEAEEREKKEADERTKREAAEAKAKEEQRKKDEAEAAERKRIQDEANSKVAAERAEREKLEQEKRDRETAEAKARADAEEKERQALLAPDKEKLLALSGEIDTIIGFSLPAVKSDKAQQIINEVRTALEEVVSDINQKAKEL